MSLYRRPLAIVQNCWADEIYQDDCRAVAVALLMSALTGVPLPAEEDSAASAAWASNRRTDNQRPAVTGGLFLVKDQLWMNFTVEIGHWPSCPLIDIRSPCRSSSET